MSQQLSDKVAVITGGSSGLGKACVERFIGEGARVVIADVDAERGEALARELGENARFKQADVSKADQVQSLIDCAVQTFGGLHIMFNNAGVSQKMVSRFVDDDMADFRRVIDVNLMGTMYGCRLAALHMKEHGGGVIINNSSISGHLPGFGVMSYRASKAAVTHFTKCIAIDFADYNIRVNCISPSNIQTEMSAFPAPGMTEDQIRRINEAMVPIRMAGQPLKRRGTPEDIANTAVFLASDQSAQITGMEIMVDGGTGAGDPINHFEVAVAARAKILQEVE